MFKRHVYTCPDVIYIINRQKKINRITLGLSLVFWGGMWIYANQANLEDALDRQENTNA